MNFSSTSSSSNLTTVGEDTDPPDIDNYNIKKATMILRALNHKFRQQVIKTIYEKKRITVTELYMDLGVEQSFASQNLAILRRAGIVSTVRDGKFVFYSINSSRLEAINELIKVL